MRLATINDTGNAYNAGLKWYNRGLVSVTPTNLPAVLVTARQYEVEAREIGKVGLAPTLRIQYNGTAVIDSPLDTLRDAWANSLERTLQGRLQQNENRLK